MKKYLKWLWVPVSMLPGACHYQWTGPWLWNHTSSSAFDAFIGLWMLNIVIVVYTIVAIVNEK